MRTRTAYVLAGLTVLAGAGVLSGVRVLMILGGLPLALLLPGTALAALLFPRAGRLIPLERVLLIPLLSLATLVLGGILAWAAGAPLHRATWLTLSAGVTLAGLAAVVLRDFRTPAVPAQRSASALAAVRDEARPWTDGDAALDDAAPDAARDDAAPDDAPDDTARDDAARDDAAQDDAAPDDATPDDALDDAARDDAAPEGDGLFEPEPMGRRRRLLGQVVPAALAVLLLAGAVGLSLGTSIRSHDVAVTTLSVAPPAAADSTGERSVQVSATGLSAGADAYQLVVSTATGGTSVAVTADGEGAWSSTLRLPADERLTLGLYRAGAAAVLRTVIVASGATS